MASRWSRLHSELYLGKEWRLGAVKDACGLTVVLCVSFGVRWHGGSRARARRSSRWRGVVETTRKIEMARVREGERGWPGLHIERARDMETLAGHARHAVASLCARSATTFTERY
jgi:hypothetical protein